jgi:hypothetical protein
MKNKVKLNPVISFLCPACGQGNESPISKVLTADVEMVYIGAGEYVPGDVHISLRCTGCNFSFAVEYDD